MGSEDLLSFSGLVPSHVQVYRLTMMNSSEGDDVGFPPNPFRSQQQTSNNTNESFYSTSGPTPAFAQPPEEQFASMPAQGDSYLYTTTTPMPAPCDPYPYATENPSMTTQSLPFGSMNTGATTLAAPQSRWEACVSCFRMSTYTAYFDVDTNDIGDRLVGAVRLFYLPDKFRSEIVGACRTETLKGPDLYGPLWITMTLVFFVAVSILILLGRLYLLLVCFRSAFVTSVIISRFISDH
jgi:hypothetical protein